MKNTKTILFGAMLIALVFVAMMGGCKKEEPASTCSDSIKNQNETAVDCGGTCAACATCSDSIQNGFERGIDCGGFCTSCFCADGYEGTNCQTLSYHKYIALDSF